MIRIRPHALAPGGLLLGLALLALPGTAKAQDACTEQATTLKAGQHIPAGNINVCNDDTTLTVTYTATFPWCVLKTDLHVATEVADIPQNRVGIPTPRQFGYGDLHDCTGTASFVIDLAEAFGDGVGPGDTLVIAAKADLRNTDTGKVEGAWGEGDRFVPRGNWGMSFSFNLKDTPFTSCVCDALGLPGFGTGQQLLNSACPGGQIADGTSLVDDTTGTYLISYILGSAYYYEATTNDHQEKYCKLDRDRKLLLNRVELTADQYESCRMHLRVSCGQP